jgi:Tol biopolymer transport system component
VRLRLVLAAAIVPVALATGEGAARSEATTVGPANGTKIAFTREHRCCTLGRARGAAAYVLDLATSREVRIGSAPDSEPGDTRPRWSPDGTLLAYAARTGDVFVVRPDGTGKRRIVRGDPLSVSSPNYEPAWSPDGTRLLVVKHGNLWTVDVATRKLRHLVASTYLWKPTWSPDGKWIAFVAPIHGFPSSTYAVSTGRRPVLKVIDGHFAHSRIYWSPDSRAVLYERCCNGEILLNSLDGRGPTRLTSGSLSGLQPWSPDGRRIVFNRGWEPDDVGGLSVINPDGSGLYRLTRNSHNGEPSWSPEGDRILMRSSAQPGGLFTIRPDGTGVTRLNHDPDPFMRSDEPEWQPLAAALSLRVTSPPRALVGNVVRHAIGVANRGSAPALRVVVRVGLPQRAQLVRLPSAARCAGRTKVTCTFARIAQNGSLKTAFSVRYRASGVARTKVSISTATFEPNRRDNRLEIRTRVGDRALRDG